MEVSIWHLYVQGVWHLGGVAPQGGVAPWGCGFWVNYWKCHNSVIFNARKLGFGMEVNIWHLHVQWVWHLGGVASQGGGHHKEVWHLQRCDLWVNYCKYHNSIICNASKLGFRMGVNIWHLHLQGVWHHKGVWPLSKLLKEIQLSHF